uniref:FHA domain-containing protein n=1 Tax=Parascaris univalens TaxID=6257 RepID=A0A915B232_PARUN
MVGSRCGGIFEGDENEQIRLDETHSERLLFTETALSKGESCTKIIAYAKRSCGNLSKSWNESRGLSNGVCGNSASVNCSEHHCKRCRG